MFNKIRESVAKQIEKYCDLEDWQSVRHGYFVYSYISFLILAVNKVYQCNTLFDVLEKAKKINLEDIEVLDYIKKINGVEELVQMLDISEEDLSISLHGLYQLFIANDFAVEGNHIVFSNGKNGRDVLGAYYTSESFAYEIAKKVINDYISEAAKDIKELTIIDNSCGAGEFLIAAIRNICEITGNEVQLSHIGNKIFGYDVDPIAVIIARLRIMFETKQDRVNSHIILGNPLIIEKKNSSVLEKFISAANGRFYNEVMSVGEDIQQYAIVLGNPPWEKVRFEEKKFLRHYYADEDVIENREKRKQLIEQCVQRNKLYYKSIESDYNTFKKSVKKNRMFQKSSCGEINTYALFTELSISMMKKGTIIGLIVKSSLLKMPVYKEFMEYLTEGKYLYDVFMFVNRNKIFNIDSREEFSVICLRKQEESNIRIALNLDEFENLDSATKTYLTPEMLKLINPETGMVPAVKNQNDLEFLVDIYKRNYIFGDVYNNVRYGRLVHFTNHADKIKKENETGYLPVYEGKFIEQYNSKYATFSEVKREDKYRSKASAIEIRTDMPDQYPVARFFIKEQFWNNLSKNFTEEYIIAWRSLTAASNKRTMIATLLPKLPTSQSLQIMQCSSKYEMLNVLALFNSIVFDYIVRLKMVGLDLTQTIVKQMPIPKKEKFAEKICFMGIEASIEKHINSRIRVIYNNDHRIDNFFDGIETYFITPDSSKKKLIYEIDILIGALYGINKDGMRNIARSFTGYYEKKELEEWF